MARLARRAAVFFLLRQGPNRQGGAGECLAQTPSIRGKAAQGLSFCLVALSRAEIPSAAPGGAGGLASERVVGRLQRQALANHALETIPGRADVLPSAPAATSLKA